jgi:hypothetical protein
MLHSGQRDHARGDVTKQAIDMQNAPWMIYLQTAVFAIAVALNVMLAHERSPRTWKQTISIGSLVALRVTNLSMADLELTFLLAQKRFLTPTVGKPVLWLAALS